MWQTLCECDDAQQVTMDRLDLALMRKIASHDLVVVRRSENVDWRSLVSHNKTAQSKPITTSGNNMVSSGEGSNHNHSHSHSLMSPIHILNSPHQQARVKMEESKKVSKHMIIGRHVVQEDRKRQAGPMCY